MSVKLAVSHARLASCRRPMAQRSWIPSAIPYVCCAGRSPARTLGENGAGRAVSARRVPFAPGADAGIDGFRTRTALVSTLLQYLLVLGLKGHGKDATP
jgi:hypothetical protein